jgi:acetolactate synthase-1/2/3 large subunit
MSVNKKQKTSTVGADVLVSNLVSQGVERIFVVPGAKIDRVLEALRQDGKIQVVLCRNEQSAAFMAAGHGRRTGKAGVVLATSGPGVANLTTGLVTATTEGDAIVAFGGAVPLSQRLKRTHQSMDNVGILKPVCKSAVEVDSVLAIAECVANAFRTAESGRAGSAFVSIPMDIMCDPCDMHVLTPVVPSRLGAGNKDAIAAAAKALNEAKLPVILCGGGASSPDAVVALRGLLSVHPIPVVSTFQGTGTVPKSLANLYCGRVGLIKNQPSDKILDAADCLLTIGYDVVEYDASLWNGNDANKNREIIHMDIAPFDVDVAYNPSIEVLGDIADSLRELTSKLELHDSLKPEEIELVVEANREREVFASALKKAVPADGLVHPLQVVDSLQKLVDRYGDDITLFSDMGSFHIWLSRYLVVHRPRQLLNTNGQQTLGVALPWAMSAAMDAKGDSREKIVSISGDGGFLFSAFEIETAVRFGLDFVHIIFDDTSYNMVAIQQMKKYGATEAVSLGSVDFVKLAESMGASGIKVTDSTKLDAAIEEALERKGVVVVQVMIDYKDNHLLFSDDLMFSAH